jgi:transcriptional regulator with XRE-family HTH domain
MKLTAQLADAAIATELGARLARARLRRGLSQQELAGMAGLAKRTLERIEDGQPMTLTNLVRLLRALDLIGSLDALIPDLTTSPIELLKQRRKERKRAPRARKSARPKGPWAWGDER